MSFGGTYKHQLDEKNRMRLPAKLREKVGDSYVVTRGADGCLFLFSTEYFETEFAPKLEKLPLSDPNARRILRFFMSEKYDVEEDKQHRFVLPEALRNYAKIQKDLVTVGSGSRIEIWSQEAYDAYNAFDDYDEALGALSAYGQ